MSKTPTPVMITREDRSRFANSELAGLIRNFGIGDIRSVSINTVWSDGVTGGSYHVENAADKTKIIRQLEHALAIQRGEVEGTPLRDA